MYGELQASLPVVRRTQPAGFILMLGMKLEVCPKKKTEKLVDRTATCQIIHHTVCPCILLKPDLGWHLAAGWFSQSFD